MGNHTITTYTRAPTRGKKLSLAAGLPSYSSQLYRAFIWTKAVPWILVNNRGWERSNVMRMLKRCSWLGFCLGTPRQCVYIGKTEKKVVLGKRVTPLRKEDNPTGRVTLLAETSKKVSCKRSILDSLEIIEKLARLGWPWEEGNPATRDNFFPYRRPQRIHKNWRHPHIKHNNLWKHFEQFFSLKLYLREIKRRACLSAVI